MIRNLVESKLPSNLTFLLDNENVCGGDLFRAFLINSTRLPVHLICMENPPKIYEDCLQWNKQIILHDFFKDPCLWDQNFNNNLENFFKFIDDFSNSSLCIDSLHNLVVRLGFSKTYRLLHMLKSSTNVICFVHEDLFKAEALEKMLSLTTALIQIKNSSEFIIPSKESCEKLITIIYEKPGGKVCAETEICSVDNNYKVSGQILNSKAKSKPGSFSEKNKFSDLTTFELGLQMKETEKKAKEQLVLPYIRNRKANNGELEEKKGGITYDFEAIDLEGDPDDDLDI